MRDDEVRLHREALFIQGGIAVALVYSVEVPPFL
jgi:hypothetical protein